MISIISFLVLKGFYTLYCTSQRATISYERGFEKWIQKNRKLTKWCGFFFLLVAYSILVTEKAMGSGTLIFLIQFMTIGSLVIILSPLKILKPQFVVTLFAVATFIEFYN